MKVAFIGLGNMGASLAKAVVEVIDPSQLYLANRSPQKVEQFISAYGGQAADNASIFENCDVIFLGVKPAQFADLLAAYGKVLEARESLLLVSMAAGLSLDKLASLVPSQHRFIRLMPNTPVSVGQGVISYALAPNCQQADEEVLQHLLAKAGSLFQLDEGQMDAATALAGCGPAFVYLFIQALSDAGVKAGLSREVAQEMAVQTLAGSAQMVAETGLHPAQLKDQVCSPAGSTIAGVAALEKQAFAGSVMEAVDAAYKRTQELGR